MRARTSALFPTRRSSDLNVGDGWGNSGAFSTQSFTGNGYVEVTASETNTYRMFEMGRADVRKSYTTKQRRLSLANNSGLEALESGSPRGGVARYAPGDKH